MPGKRSRRRGISAWLVTWERIGSHVRIPRKIAAVLSPRLSAERVKQIVRVLHANEAYTVGERINWTAHPEADPYPPEYASLDGVPWQGQIRCGHNPYLFARLVDHLRAVGRIGSTRAKWRERPLPRVFGGRYGPS